MFALAGLFMKLYAYVSEGGNEGGRGATPTSISIFDSYLVILASKCQDFKLKGLQFHFIKTAEKRASQL